MTFFRKTISIFTPKISHDLSFSHRPGFSDFPYLYCVLNVVYDPFFTRKTTISGKNSLIRPFFYSVRTFAHIRQHYFSKYWGGPMPSPHLKFLRGPSPQSSLGLSELQVF